MKIGAGLLILTAGAMLLLGDYSHGDASGHRHRAGLFRAAYTARNNPYFDVLNEGIEKAVEANDDILLTRDPLRGQERRNEQIQEMIGKGIQMLFLNPMDQEEVQPALDVCREAGVGIISVDTVVKDRGSVISIIEADNYQADQLCALDMMERKDEAKIIILDNPIQTSITSREQRFLDTIADNHDYQVVYRGAAAGETEVSSHVMADLLCRDINFNVILGGSDPTILGALAALQQARGKEGVLIYGIDDSPGFEAILDVGYVTRTSAQSPRSMGREAAETTYRYLDGEPVEKYISMSSTIITRNNLHEFGIDGWRWEDEHRRG